MTPFSCVDPSSDKNDSQELSTLPILQLIHTEPNNEFPRINDIRNATYTASGRVQVNPSRVQMPGSFGISTRIIALDRDQYFRETEEVTNDQAPRLYKSEIKESREPAWDHNLSVS